MWQGYIKSIKVLIYVCICMPALLYAAANQTGYYVEGQDYVKLPESVRANENVKQLISTDAHKVQVLFFFSYGCHGCEMMHTPFDNWAQSQLKENPTKVKVYFYPVAFNAQWAALARLFYVRETVDPTGKLNNAIFSAVHKEGLKLWDVNVMRKFFVKHGISAETFDQTYNAFTINMRVQRAETLSKAYSVTATPDIIVNGPVNSYRIEVAKVGKNMNRLMDIINYLVNRELKLL